MTRHRIAQISENRNPKSPENRPQTRRFLQIRLLQLRRSATPFNGLAVLHRRLNSSEAKLRASEERHSLITQAVAEGVYEWDVERNSLWPSARLIEIFGFEGRELRAGDW